jgi:hypothetical protein
VNVCSPLMAGFTEVLEQAFEASWEVVFGCAKDVSDAFHQQRHEALHHVWGSAHTAMVLRLALAAQQASYQLYSLRLNTGDRT